MDGGKNNEMCKIVIKIFVIVYFSFSQVAAFEIIRDTELEQFTHDIIDTLLKSNELKSDDINVYFINSDQVNAFVTGGKNIFINTETIIEASDYREYAAVLAHELAHIIGGHIFNTSIEISNLSDKALPIYLLGMIGIITGSADTGLVGIMVGQASVNDGFTFYSRTQEASADQAAVKILCKNGIEGKYLLSFLEKIEKIQGSNIADYQNYKSTHPSTQNRINWISSSLQNYNCAHKSNKELKNRFDLLKAKLHGFTHKYSETDAIYNDQSDVDLYATAVSSYFQGNHSRSITNLKRLIEENPKNPFYKELLGEIYFANGEYDKAIYYQELAIKQINKANDLYYMMMGNYLLNLEKKTKSKDAIKYLKKSIYLNPKNAHAWYLLSRAYAQIESLPLANYATAERYFLTGERELSYEFATKALKNIEENSPEWYRSSDLIKILKKDISE